MIRQPYVSIDIETTGLNPDYCQILEIGAVIDDWVTPIDQLSTFHCYVVHDRIVGEPFALAMNAEILGRIADRAIHHINKFLRPDQVTNSLGFFLRTHLGDKALAAGKNFASFDLQFLRRLPQPFLLKFHHRSIDPCMLYWNPATDQEPPSTKVCMERAGIAGEVAHTAVEDALTVVKLIRYAAADRGLTERYTNGDRFPHQGIPRLGL